MRQGVAKFPFLRGAVCSVRGGPPWVEDDVGVGTPLAPPPSMTTQLSTGCCTTPPGAITTRLLADEPCRPVVGAEPAVKVGLASESAGHTPLAKVSVAATV